MSFRSPSIYATKHASIRRIILWLGHAIFFLLGFLIPAGLSVMVLLEIYEDNRNDVNVTSDVLLEHIYHSPEHSDNHAEALQAMLTEVDEHEVAFVLSDENGIISQTKKETDRLHFEHCVPVFVDGKQEATLCGYASLKNTVVILTFLWIAFIIVGYLAYRFLAVEPVAILDATIADLEKKAAEARSANLAKSEFLSVMSHEIRTPLNGIVGMTELLTSTELNRDQKIYADTIDVSSQALLSIINDILDFSKINARRVQVSEEPFDLRKLAEGVVRLLAPQATKKGLDLFLRVDPNIPTTVRGDASKLRQILLNLAGNGVKYTPSGQVFVNLSLSKLDTNSFYQMTCEITDTGNGISEQDQKTLFDKFSRVDVSQTRSQEGTGLGLAITKGLVEAMGGQIGVESDVGLGSTFWFRIQLIPDTHSKTPPRVLQDWPVIHGKRILIIDENPTQSAILEELLFASGMKTHVANDAISGLAAFDQAVEQELPYSVVLLDQSLSGLSKAEFCDEMGQRVGAHQVPIVVITTIGNETGLACADKNAPCSIIAKPVIANDLIEAISAALVSTPDQNQIPPPDNANTSTAAMPTLISHTPVLVVDDNATNRLLIQKFLQRLGLKSTFACDGVEAVEAYKTDYPDIILMDVSMPIMDGLKATELIREHERDIGHPPAHIVGVTANAVAGFELTCLEAGMDEYLTKPITLKKLGKKILSLNTPERRIFSA